MFSDFRRFLDNGENTKTEGKNTTTPSDKPTSIPACRSASLEKVNPSKNPTQNKP